MSNYLVDFQSGGIEASPTIPGKTSITLPQNVTNTTASSLTLTGKGVANYGEIQQENFIRLLENFASKTAPQNPTVGQLWFDSAKSELKVYGMDLTWKSTGGGVIAANTAPSNPGIGQLWYDIPNQSLMVWNGSAWVAVGAGLSVGTTPPSPSIEGQLWYNSSEKILYMKQSASGGLADYPRYFSNTWVQIWPEVVQYGGYVEYNELATKINRIVGAPSTFGALADPADNQYGWGQTDVLPIFTDMSTPTAFDNNAWTILASRLRKALRHTTIAETTVPTMGYIRDGRGPNNTATSYSPNVGWLGGWQGYGIAGMATNWAALQNAVSSLDSNRFTISTSGSQIVTSRTDQTVGATWASTRILDISVQFANDAAAKAFFNVGGAIRVTPVTTTGTTIAAYWYSTLTNATLSTNGFVIDYKGCKIGLTGSYINGSTSLGFYDLNTGLQNLYTLARTGSAYGSGSFVVSAAYNSSNGNFAIRLYFNEDFAANQTANKLTVTTDIRLPVFIVSSLPHINSPVIATPAVTATGTFLTAPAAT